MSKTHDCRTSITIYTTPTCPYCVKAKALLDKKGLPYTEIDVSKDPSKIKEMMVKSYGRKTVPQIFVVTHVGGFDDLSAMEKDGSFNELLGIC